MYMYVYIHIYIYIPERQWVRRLRTVSTCVLCRCSLSSWRFQKYFVFWVKMHIAWFLLDGVVCFARMCAELGGIEFVCVSSSCFLCIASFYACTVRWVGVGWGGADNVQLDLYSHVMRRSWTFSCSSTHTSCYASARHAWGWSGVGWGW